MILKLIWKFRFDLLQSICTNLKISFHYNINKSNDTDHSFINSGGMFYYL